MTGAEIAIVGIGCRFPGADTPDAFWELLSSTQSRLGPAPAARAAWAEATDEPWLGAFLDDVHALDGDYFEIAPREAAGIDPQQRLILITAALALEDAGIGRRELSRHVTGVYTGVSAHDHSILTWAPPAADDRYATSGTANGLTANRVSYWLKATGPSVAFDTACSSALVALHYARLGLMAGECDYALCAAASVMLLPHVTASLRTAGLVSESGRCRPLARGADGYLRGEGAGAVLLCRLDDAMRRGHRIYALLRGSAINHNGASNGLTAPNPTAQADVVTRAHASAGTVPETCAYVEAMAASRELADTLELKALDATVGRGRGGVNLCGVGSLKGHIGHLEAAAGIAGLIKCALMLQRCELAPTAGVDAPNPYLRRDGVGLALVMQPTPLPPQAIVGVSAFGFGGANAHVVLGTAPVTGRREPHGAARQVLTFSAWSREALRPLVAAYREHLRSTDDDLRDICHTSHLSRTEGPLLVAVGGASCAELAGYLDRLDMEDVMPAISGAAAVLCLGVPSGEGTHERLVLPLDTAHEPAADLLTRVYGIPVASPCNDARREDCPRRVALPGYPFVPTVEVAETLAWLRRADGVPMRDALAAQLDCLLSRYGF